MRRVIDLVGGLLAEAGTGGAPLDFHVAVRGVHSGQMDLTLEARRDGRLVGTLDYAEYQGTVSIQMIKAHERRLGVGTALVRHLQSLHPGRELDWGMTTEDGEKLRRSLPTEDRVDPGLQARFERLDTVRAELAALQSLADAYWADAAKSHSDSRGTEEKREAMLAHAAGWNDLHDEEYRLAQELDGRSPVTRIIR